MRVNTFRAAAGFRLPTGGNAPCPPRDTGAGIPAAGSRHRAGLKRRSYDALLMATLITVKVFGPEATAAGRREVTVAVEAERPNCAELRRALAEAEPALAPRLDHCRFAVNNDYAAEDQRIGPDDEVALIGPVSGG